MATTRKDLRGRTLRKGEMQRSSDKRYAYSYKDPLGRRKYIYANDLVTLRERETQLTKDQLDGLDIYVAGKATVNFVFDRYMSLKTNLRQTTRSNYLYMYDRFVRDTFGKKKIAVIRYSDVLQFYNYLLDKQDLQVNTLESVHTLLHPTFQLAVRNYSEEPHRWCADRDKEKLRTDRRCAPCSDDSTAAGVHGAYRQSPGLLPLVAAVYGAAGNGLSHR